jgi:hypothetical protein
MVSAEDIIMEIKKPHFTVKLHGTSLEVDLNKGVRKELEDVLEARPAIRESLGFLFQTIVPLDVQLKDIESVKVDKKGQVKVVIPSRRDITIPLKPNESKRLVEKMNEYITLEKERAVRDAEESKKTRRAMGPKVSAAQVGAESLERIGR